MNVASALQINPDRVQGIAGNRGVSRTSIIVQDLIIQVLSLGIRNRL